MLDPNESLREGEEPKDSLLEGETVLLSRDWLLSLFRLSILLPSLPSLLPSFPLLADLCVLFDLPLPSLAALTGSSGSPPLIRRAFSRRSAMERV